MRRGWTTGRGGLERPPDPPPRPACGRPGEGPGPHGAPGAYFAGFFSIAAFSDSVCLALHGGTTPFMRA
jgi:hypothetical protein